MSKKITLAFVILGFSAAFLSALPLVVDRVFVPRFFAQWQAKELPALAKNFYEHLEEFQTDVEILKPKLDLLSSKNFKDAGPFLNPRVSWDFSDNDPSKVKEYESRVDKNLRIEVPVRQRDLLKEANGKVLELDSKNFAQINTDWLSQLRVFDHWNIDKNSPLDLYPRNSIATPYPNYSLDAVKIHLIKAKNKNNAAYADIVLDSLHYGKLCFTTETLVGEMVFVAILGLAKTALEARPAVKVQLAPWLDLIEEKDRLKRMFWATNQFARPNLGADPQTLNKVYLAQTATTGICAVVREATSVDWPV